MAQEGESGISAWFEAKYNRLIPGRHRLTTWLENKNQLSRVADFWQLDTGHLGRQSGSITDILEQTNITMYHRWIGMKFNDSMQES